jgi:hypothetical protein
LAQPEAEGDCPLLSVRLDGDADIVGIRVAFGRLEERLDAREICAEAPDKLNRATRTRGLDS